MFAVRIDGQLVSDSFQLFDASTEIIASHVCEECYAGSGGQIATCGHADIAVRRHEDTIYWFLADYEYVSPLTPNARLNQVWSFLLETYELQLNGDTSRLPDFSMADIQLILNRATIYPAEFGLFTIPDIDGDPQGRQLLDVIGRSITANDLVIVAAPETYRTITIGIESEGIPEVVIDVGVINRRCAIRFVAHPSFPLWLTSDEIHRNMMPIAAEQPALPRCQ